MNLKGKLQPTGNNIIRAMLDNHEYYIRHLYEYNYNMDIATYWNGLLKRTYKKMELAGCDTGDDNLKLAACDEMVELPDLHNVVLASAGMVAQP